jgi:hypothetical protein
MDGVVEHKVCMWQSEITKGLKSGGGFDSTLPMVLIQMMV